MRYLFAPLFSLAVITSSVAADSGDIRRFHLNESGEKAVGYAQAVRVGKTLYISGSVGTGAMPDAIKSAYETLKKTLTAHGLDFTHVVKETVFATNIDALIEHKAVRREYYRDSLPAATWVQVERLYTPEMVIEVELIAAIP